MTSRNIILKVLVSKGDKMKEKKVSILGAGSWGTALAKVLAENGHNILMWNLHEEVAEEINSNHTNKNYLPNVQLPNNIHATTNLEEAVAFAGILVIVIPTQAIRQLASQLDQLINDSKLIIHASKGLEQGTHKRISTVISEEISAEKRQAIVALSGPSHAEEVAVHDLTSITAASPDLEAAEFVQDLFMNDYFRVYTNKDIIGVELGAAIKNIIAIGAGILVGLGYGDNAMAALVTRGLVEIKRLGVALGAEPDTFDGLSGVGDLIVTCKSPFSRNWQAGKAIGEGKEISAISSDIKQTVEGLSTVIAAYELAELKNIEMPITEAIYQVTVNQIPIREAILNLMRREGKEE